MPYRVVQFQSTPNPHACKCVLDRAVAPLATPAPGLRAYIKGQTPAPDADALARALLALAGVRNVLIHDATAPGWVTVGKLPEVDWKKLKPAIEQALAGAP